MMTPLLPPPLPKLPPVLPDGLHAEVVAGGLIRVDLYGEIHGSRASAMIDKAAFLRMLRTLAKVSTQA